MICIILVAGHGVVLEREIQVRCAATCRVMFTSGDEVFQEDTSGNFSHLIGIPKALLPASGGVETETILDCWWSALKR